MIPLGSVQVCRISGATPRQLRYWLDTGLVTASVQTSDGTPGRPNLFTPEDAEAVGFIVQWQHAGGSLQGLRAEREA
jgi:DNA-binding transcriptional MerR regulator